MELKQGDTIGIIALSGDCDRERVDDSKKYIEACGYKVRLSHNIYDTNRYLAGSDEDKLSELYEFYQDSDVKLILAARGGYGAIRLINKIDYEIIKNHPKPICGFSDCTAILLMVYKNTGLITYYSPMALSDFTTSEKNEFSREHFYKALSGAKIDFNGGKIYHSGEAEGIIWGGNLSTVVSLCGVDFIPQEDFIFFAEDLNEPVYKIDKMFQQLVNIREFKKYCRGIVLGDFLDVDNETWLEEYFQELAENLNVPVAGGFQITHGEDKITVPIGRKSKLEKNILSIL